MTVLRDILCSLTTGDRIRGPDGRYSWVTGRRAIAQWIASRVRTWAGEWHWNTEYGTAWARYRSVKPAPVRELEAHLRRVISAVPGVLNVTLRITLQPGTRTATLTAAVSTIDGPIPIEATLNVAGAAMVLVSFTVLGEGIWPTVGA